MGYQFYFLSIILNLIIGLMLSFDSSGSTVEKILDTKESLLHLVVGVLSVFISLVKLIVPAGNGFPFFGDFLIMLAGFAGGACLLVKYLSEKNGTDVKLPSFLRMLLVDKSKFIGYYCLAASVLHFIMPEAPVF